MLYFAYGSNMSQRQMAQRCPGAKFVGAGQLPGWRFVISKRGGANIVPDRTGQVFGTLWRCQQGHIAMLDRYEGVAAGVYRRVHIRLKRDCGAGVTAISYISINRTRGLGRINYMGTAVLPGARSTGLPEGYVRELEGWLPARPIGDRARRYVGRKRSQGQKLARVGARG